MATRRPISTAPRDGTRVRLVWTDRDGQENEAPGRYHSAERLRRSGGDWDASDEGWWVFVDSATLNRIDPQEWVTGDDED